MNKRRRVVFVVPGLSLGGIERVTVDLCLELQQTQEWEPIVCCIKEKSGGFLSILEKHRIPVYECPLTPRMPLRFSYAFSSLLRQLSADLVHSHVTYSLIWQVIGARLLANTPIMFTQQNEYPSWTQRRLVKLRLRFYYHVCRPFIAKYSAVSNHTRRYLARVFSTPVDSFEVIYNTVNTENFRPDAMYRARARRLLGVQESDFVVGNVASLTEQKGHLHLLQAAYSVVQADSNVQFVIIGEGPLRQRLENRAVELGIENHVKFLGSKLDVHVLFNGFDCFALSSLWEGGPIVVGEAMACALPVISTDVGMVSEFGCDNSIVIIPPGEADALAEAILRVKADPALAKRLAFSANRRVADVFSVPAVLQKYTEIYNSILD